MRTFVAIPLSRETSTRLAEARRRLRLNDVQVRWVDPAQFHLTLRFLGSIPPADVDRVIDATREGVRGFGPFTIGFSGFGAFPGWSRPRVLWARIAENDVAVRQLALSVEKAIVRAGFPGADRPFSPHVTLGRLADPLRRLEPPDEIDEGTPVRERVERVVVFESRLRPAGPIYIERAALPLGEDES